MTDRKRVRRERTEAIGRLLHEYAAGEYKEHAGEQTKTGQVVLRRQQEFENRF